MPTLLYITASQFSGSTLASFLLNTHPEITTVGHTTGWKFGPDEEFRCSCGELLEDCPFYRRIAEAFAEHGLAFDPRDFGTAYRLSDKERIDQWLTRALPVASSRAERLRDTLVRLVPRWRRRLAATDLANLTFVETALEWSGARVFLDNSQSPYRLRYLARIRGVDPLNLYLVRDPRGTVLSMMTHAGWDAALATRLWLRRQSDIIRIARELPASLLVHYETLCTEPDRELGRVHRYLGLEPHPFDGDFKAGEHHILGNVMRFRGGKVALDERWRRDLGTGDRDTVERIARNFAQEHPRHPLSAVVEHYLNTASA